MIKKSRTVYAGKFKTFLKKIEICKKVLTTQKCALISVSPIILENNNRKLKIDVSQINIGDQESILLYRHLAENAQALYEQKN